MSPGAQSPELQKLAHQLGVPSTELSCVATLAEADLRTLRGQIADALFEADKHHFDRMACLAKAVPVPLAARISELALPPLLAARTAELFEPARAAEMVSRMSGGYVANVAAAMDPARSPQVVAAMPAEHVAMVATELAGRGEWIVMGAFVSFVNAPALRAAIAELDGEQLLRISFVLDDSSRVDEISQLLTAAQLDEMLACVPEHDLWRELDGLLAELDDTELTRLAARYAVAGDTVRAALEAGRDEGRLDPAGFARLTA